MPIWAKALAALCFLFAWLFLIPKKTDVLINAGLVRAKAVFAVSLIFGLVKLKIRFSVFYENGTGFVIERNGKNRKKLAPKKGRKAPRIFKALTAKSIEVSGFTGVEGRPDISVFAAGGLTVLFDMAVPAVFKIPPKTDIRPHFEGNRFKISLSGIMSLNMGKLIIEILKSKRRNKNESPDRKHNAVIDGAHQEACGR